ERKRPREPSLISTQEEPKRSTILSSSKSITTKRKKLSELYPILYKLLKKTSAKNENITVPTSDVPKAHSPIVNNENQDITARHSTVHSQGQTSATLFAAIDSSPIQRQVSITFIRSKL
ncbi:hypothetical protein BgiMline_010647, partial [Biomphalaria glabrata]